MCTLINPLTPGKHQMASFLALLIQFRPNPPEQCFLARTISVSFGFRTLSSLFSSGIRTIQFSVYAKNSPVYGSSRFCSKSRCFRSHFDFRFLLSS